MFDFQTGKSHDACDNQTLALYTDKDLKNLYDEKATL